MNPAPPLAVPMALGALACQTFMLVYWTHRLIALEKLPSFVCAIQTFGWMLLIHRALLVCTDGVASFELTAFAIVSAFSWVIIAGFEMRQPVPFLGALAFLGGPFRPKAQP